MDGLIKYTMFFGLVVFMIFSPKEPEESDSQEIVSIVEDFNNALIHLNKSGLKKMTSEDLSYGHSDGSVQDKNEFIEGVMNGSFRFVTIDMSELSVQMVDDIAIVRHVLDSDYQNKQDEGHLQIGNLMIWRKDGRKWKLLARQSFKL